MPFNLGPGELIIILVIALLILGPGKLPDVGSALGKSIREFRKAATDVQDASRIDQPATPPPATPPPAAPPGPIQNPPVAPPPPAVPPSEPSTEARS